MSNLEFARWLPSRAATQQGRTGFVLLLALTVVVMFTNDSAREYLKVSIGDVHLIERDFFLYGLLALFLMNVAVSGRTPHLGKFGAYAVSLVGLYYLGILNGLRQGNDPKQIFFHIRQVNYLLVYFPFTIFISSPQRLRAFLRATLACILAGAALTVIISAYYAQSDLVTRNEFLWITGGAHGRYFHVRVATAFFFVTALDILLAMWELRCDALSRRNIILMWALICLALGLTVLRSYWVGLVASLLFLLGTSNYRARLIARGMFLAALGALVLVIFFETSDISRYVQEQLLTSFDTDSIAISDRLSEHYIGAEAIKQNFWIGRGLGATVVVHLDSIGQTIETSFFHDSFLTILMFFGLLGCAAMACILFLVFRSGTRLYRARLEKDNRFGAALATGCLAGLLGLLATSVTAAALNYATGFFLVGIVLGILDRLAHFEEL